MANEYVSDGYKDRLRVAARSGRDDGVCQVRFYLKHFIVSKNLPDAL